MKQYNMGIYPVMLTPFKNGEVDYDGVKKLTEFYIKNGCQGVFAVCQSSEMQFLTLEEKVKIAKTVVETANGRMTVVASGHTSDSLEEQAKELNAIYHTGVDAVVLSSNRLDINNEGEKVWLKNADKLLSMLDKDMPLGFYECPKPYKKLLSKNMLDWCIKQNRFKFIKDTCCNPVLLEERIKQLEGSGIMLFNANGQTLLQTLKQGAHGYSGVIANFCPDLYVWLFNNFKSQPEKAEKLGNMLSLLSCIEDPAYPITAKYYLNSIGLDISLESRSCPKNNFDLYHKQFIDQIAKIIEELRKEFK